jgi:DNA gyrase subunit A
MPAAMRYTEVRMEKVTNALLDDLENDTVDYRDNYDGTIQEPSVLPAKFPNLLVNGAGGIAVGMATNVPPHNLTEVVGACIALIDDPELGFDQLLHLVPGPDFPTAGIINGSAGIVEAYKTGRGRILVRAKTEIETDDNGRETIIVTEIPYQVNKARLIEKIAELVKEKKLEGISQDGLRDESDKDGLRIVIEVRRDTSADVLLNNLFQQTQLQVTFGINMVALANIDEMIELIKASPDAETARERMLSRRWAPGLVASLLAAAGAEASRPEDMPVDAGLRPDGYQLTEVQAQQILEMRLHRLTGLEQDKLSGEYTDLLTTIAGLIEILENPERLLEVIRDELTELKEQYGDARRTVIQSSQEDLDILDLIAPEDVVVTLSHAGYAKRQPVSIYRAQRRGGRGRSATAMKEEDFVERLWIANTHDTLLTFTSAGRVFWLKVHQLPDAGPNARGKPIVNLLPLEPDEKVQAVQPVREFADDRYVFFATRNGTVKKTPLKEFEYQLQRGKIAIGLDEGDALVDVQITDGSRDIMLFASNGKAVRFAEDEVRSMGRTATGVRGMKLASGEHVMSLVVVEGDDDILTATERGFGKRTELAEYPRKGRGTQGVIAIQCSERNGALIGAVQLGENHELMLISNLGTLVRTRASEVARVGRNTQGVTLIRLPAEEQLVGVVRVEALGEEGNGVEADGTGTEPAPEGSPTIQ